jgi:hypothetical protein
MTARVDDCGGDPKACFDSCGIIGREAAQARVSAARFHGADRPAELRLPAVSAPPALVRKVGLFERLIAGPQGDVTLKDDFLSFLGCVACGTGLAFLLVGIVMFFRTVAP